MSNQMMALILMLAAFPAAAPAATMHLGHLTCEYREAPLGVDVGQPRLGWWLNSELRGQSQAAYQVLVASSAERLAAGEGDLWDSGRVESEESTQIVYGGRPLEALEECHWKVRAWPSKPTGAEPSEWSRPSRWRMGLPRPEDWKGRWVTHLKTPHAEAEASSITRTSHNSPNQKGSDGGDGDPLPIFRKAFPIGKPVRSAAVSICGLGHYELSINGERVGDNQIDTGWTNYRESCLYSTFDVTEAMRDGENAIGVMLGNGMYNVMGGRYVKFKGSYGVPKLIAQLDVEYEDGTHEAIGSDETWKWSPGPILFSCVFGGEDHDARQEQPGWDQPGFDDSRWAAATVTQGPGGRLVAQAQPPVKVMERFETADRSEPERGVEVFDLGQNFSGWPVIAVSGAAGSRVRLIPGELLDETGKVSQAHSGSPVYFDYTLNGEGEERWKPRFTYYGFRYVQVERAAANEGGAPPVVGAMSGEFIHSSAAVVGKFECSNELVNRIHRLILAAVRSNMQSVLSDCPHREKLGWLEQSYLAGRGIMFNYDVPNLYAKISRDMAESQTAKGLVPDIAPEYVVFRDGFRDSPEWGSASILNPWLMWQMYGDRRILEENYEVMARYEQYLAGKAKDGIIAYGLGDWFDVAPGAPGVSKLTSLGLTATATYYRDLMVMREAAELLGRAEEARKYAEKMEATRAAFNRSFYHADTNSYDRGSQTANAMALTLGLVEERNRPAVLESLVAQIRAGGNQVTAGDIGFHYLVAALAEGGRGDVLYDMVTQETGPGYAYQLKQGATSLTEAWDSNPRTSQNHFMLGHAEDWFYSGLGGIEPAAPGFRTIRIRPAFADGLEWVRASYNSVRGPIESRWERVGGKIRLHVQIPIGATALVSIPAASASGISEQGKLVADIEEVKVVESSGNGTVLEVPSGTYRFEVGNDKGGQIAIGR